LLRFLWFEPFLNERFAEYAVDGDAATLLARKAAGGDVADLEAAIDGAVCRLFGVGEIGMVEGKGTGLGGVSRQAFLT